MSNRNELLEIDQVDKSVLERLLKVPKIELLDGTYYQPGAVWLFGTPIVDINDQPVKGATADAKAAIDTFLSEM